MFDILRRHLDGRHGAHVAGAQLGLVAALSVALSAVSPPADRAQAHLRAPAPGQALRTPPAGLARAALTDMAKTDAASAPDPATAVIRLQDLNPDQARAWNAANPISKAANPPAKPFHLETEGVLEEARAVDCMTAAIYYEAGNESVDGERAVAQVVLNRLRHPAFPKTVCGVVFQGAERHTGCQFTFACDGSLTRTPSDEGWARARSIAQAALHGYVQKAVGEATHYHAVYVAPYWSPTLVKVAAIGAHVFYRWTGGAGLPPAFAGTYAGGEAAAVRVATLDGLARTSARVAPAAAPVVEPSAEPTQVAEASAAAPVLTAVEPAAVEVTSPATAASDARAVVPARDLDWQGRPKEHRPPRLAMPSAAPSF